MVRVDSIYSLSTLVALVQSKGLNVASRSYGYRSVTVWVGEGNEERWIHEFNTYPYLIASMDVQFSTGAWRPMETE